jgi:hypothetical protein
MDDNQEKDEDEMDTRTNAIQESAEIPIEVSHEGQEAEMETIQRVMENTQERHEDGIHDVTNAIQERLDAKIGANQ